MPKKIQEPKVFKDNARTTRSKSNAPVQATQESSRREKSKTPAPKKPTPRNLTTSPIKTNRKPKAAPKTAPKKNVAKVKEVPSSSESEEQEELAYKIGEMVAFLDKNDAEEGKAIISIGKVLQNSTAENTELKIQQFVPVRISDKYPVEFVESQRGSELVIDLYQIVSGTDQGKVNSKTGVLKFSKPTITKIAQLLGNQFDTIREKVNAEIEAKHEESDKSDPSDSSEEEIKESLSPLKTSQEVILAKRRSVERSSSQNAVVSSKENARQASVKAAARIKQQIEDLESENDEILEQDNHDESVNPNNQVRIGKKRAAPFQDAEGKVVSRRVKKLADGTEVKIVKVVAKGKRAPKPKKPVVFKRGKINPDTVLLTQEQEIERFDKSDQPIFTCCLRCNNRNVIRAIESDNLDLFCTLLRDTRNIPSLTDCWSAESQHLQPLRMILQRNKTEWLKVLFTMHQRNYVCLQSKEQSMHQLYVSGRVRVKPYLLHKVDTGSVSHMAYGAEVRKVEQTRGNRQGNQAFYFDQLQAQVPVITYTSQDLKVLTPDVAKLHCLLTNQGDPTQHFLNQITQIARVGNRALLAWLIEPLIKHENYGFNDLHLDVLRLDKLTFKYHTASITKKSVSAGQITPLHLACINPNSEILSTLLEQNNDFNVLDSENYKPIHYAAACSDPANMEVLVAKGASLFDLTTTKQSALHIAAINGNALLIKLILEKNIDLFKIRDQNNKTAFANACELGQIEPIKAFLDFSSKKVKVGTRSGINRMTPLMYAASQGNYELAEFLLERKARVLATDKFKRTALIMAVRNGHTRLASLLLQRGSEWNHPDSSNNTPLHYAAGSGFIECIDLLINHGADVKADNIWKVNPLTIAMLNNHQGAVRRLIQEPLVEVNGKDDKGRTLLMLACLDLSDSSCVEFASHLIEKGADPNMSDLDGNTPLITTCKNISQPSCIDMVKCLLEKGANPNIVDKQGNTPLKYACVNLSQPNCMGLATSLLENGANPNLRDSQGNTPIKLACTDLSNSICVDMIRYLLDQGADPNIADNQGNTPLITLASYNVGAKGMYGYGGSSFQQQQINEKKWLLELIELLISRGAELDTQNLLKQNAFSIALERDNIDVLKLLTATVRLSSSPRLFHRFQSKIFDDRYKSIIVELMNKEALSRDVMNILDSNGFTPFLAYIKQFYQVLNDQSIHNVIREVLQWNTQQHQLEYDRYQVTNELIFTQSFKQDPKYQNQNYYYRHQIPQDKLQSMIHKYFEELITQPLIQFLKNLIQIGADPNAKVGKLESYRELKKFYHELDEFRRNLVIVPEEENKDGPDSDEEMDIDLGQVKIKTRAQVLAEQSLLHKVPVDGAIKKLSPRKMEISLFCAKKGRQFNICKNRKQYLNRQPKYDREYGLQNSVHLAMRYYNKSIFEFLVDDLKTPVDELDFLGRNPFMFYVLFSQVAAQPYRNVGSYNYQPQYDVKISQTGPDSVKRLLELNVRIDLKDEKGRTPFLIYYEQNNHEMANKLLRLGADINTMNLEGQFALKYALSRKNLVEIQRLVSEGADINKIDTKGRNLLHHQVNMSSATADATFETEQVLIDLGININLRDNKQRVPLHYAFVKIRDWNNAQPIDPIETVSSLFGQKNLDIDVPDKWQKTPLHYASQRGASISTLYILNRGSNLEAKDIYGNTALGIALIRKHYSYAIILIQRKADVRVPVCNEFQEQISQQWAAEANAAKRQLEYQSALDKEAAELQIGADVVMQESPPKHLMIDTQVLADDELSQFDASSESEHDEQEKESVRLKNIYETALEHLAKLKAVVQKESSTFLIAISHQQLGLAYMILDTGFEYMLAMQDALDNKMFNLVLTLFSKVPDDGIIQQKNLKQQNLMHILAQNSSGGQFTILRRIYDTLRKRGVNCLERDSLGSNPLHYALQKNCFDLCRILVQEGVGVNEINIDGHSPITLWMRGREGAQRTLRTIAPDGKEIDSCQTFSLLAKSGADMNVVYPENSLKDIKEKEDYKATIIINLVRHQTGSQQIIQNLKCLFDFGAKLDLLDSKGKDAITYALKNQDLGTVRLFLERGAKLDVFDSFHQDPLVFAITQNNLLLTRLLLEFGSKLDAFESHSKNALMYAIKRKDKPFARLFFEFGAKLKVVDDDGKDALMHAILFNDIEMVNLVLSNRENGLIRNHTDIDGKNAIHYVVNSAKFGSFENVDILNALIETEDFFNLNQTDKFGKTPLDYAFLQHSGTMAQVLQVKLGVSTPLLVRNAISYIPDADLPARKYNFAEDASLLLQKAEAQEAEQLMEDSDNDYVPIDEEFEDGVQYKVYYDGPERRPYDAYLQKVDLKNGPFGDYVFYKLQLIHDTNRDLYLVLTRWGRIGEENSMHQRTPFDKVEDAKKDFETIFRKKSGNEWATAETVFVRQPKLYSLVKISYSNVQYRDYLAPFDKENSVKTQLPELEQQLLEEIADVTLIKQAYSSYGMDASSLPISKLTKDKIQEAKNMLMELKKLITQLSDEKIKLAEANYDLVQELRYKISDLSSKYYELIPKADTRYCATVPIENQDTISKYYNQLEQLTNVEYSSKMLLGALYRQPVVNPVDYIKDCLQIQITSLEKSDAEYDVIAKYISNTSNQNVSEFLKFNLFKIERRGEGERYDPFKALKNKRLLFHGSAMTNMLGIMSQGLRIAPPEASTTGYMFGKGIYFADTFEKSVAYTGANQYRYDYNRGKNNSGLMLMCEVALGQMMELYQPHYVEKLPPNFDSVKGCGARGPNFDRMTIFTPQGFQVPLSETSQQQPPTEEVVTQSLTQAGIPLSQIHSMFTSNNYSGYNNRPKTFNWQLQLNEYIVYNTDQVKMRYIIQFQM